MRIANWIVVAALGGIACGAAALPAKAVVVMAADRTGLIYQGAFGVADISEARPLQLDSMFRIASMTKAITSTAALQLVEQGRFAIEDPVEKYLPQFAKLPVFESFDGATGNYKL